MDAKTYAYLPIPCHKHASTSHFFLYTYTCTMRYFLPHNHIHPQKTYMEFFLYTYTCTRRYFLSHNHIHPEKLTWKGTCLVEKPSCVVTWISIYSISPTITSTHDDRGSCNNSTTRDSTQVVSSTSSFIILTVDIHWLNILIGSRGIEWPHSLPHNLDMEPIQSQFNIGSRGVVVASHPDNLDMAPIQWKFNIGSIGVEWPHSHPHNLDMTLIQ